jgi:hypothetical protein
MTVALCRLVLGLSLATTFAFGSDVVLAKTIHCPEGATCTGTKRADTITGDGANSINGRGGGDTITVRGRFGNIISGGRGNDVIDAANNVGNDIDCGPGKDQVTINSSGGDIIKNCETIIVTG